MKIVNLTPHAVNVKNENGEMIIFNPSGQIVRVETISNPKDKVNFDGFNGSFALYQTELKQVVNLPPENEDDGQTLYIVSALVALNKKGDKRLICLHGLLRDEKGNIIGAEGFTNY